MYLVVYITPNKTLICRFYRFTLLKLYDTRNSSKWFVISIGKVYKNKVISLSDYRYICSKELKRIRIKNNLSDYISKYLKILVIYILPFINTLLFILFFFNRK